MSVEGKHKDEWVAVTLCDFGQPDRREPVTHHYSIDTALRAWKRNERLRQHWGGRFWQETRDGQILNDTAK